MTEPLLRIEDLYVRFRTDEGTIRAVNGVNLEIMPGEMFGLVGESGCGKSVTGLSILKLVPHPGRITRGKIWFRGENLLEKPESAMREIRGRHIAMIFQDPMSSLNPVFTVGHQITRVIRRHHHVSRREAWERAAGTLDDLGIPDPERVMRSYPYELSGGMQQRVMIAIALSCGAELLIADEPTTALDVTIQAQILELLNALRIRRGVSILMITHDLGVVAETCDRVAVLYAGRVVESGPTDAVLQAPAHPYTQGLLNALPRPSARRKSLQAIPGSVPGGIEEIPGCPFHPRCALADDLCRSKTPIMTPVDSSGAHLAACHLIGKSEG